MFTNINFFENKFINTNIYVIIYDKEGDYYGYIL